ncbi:MAG: NUDIX domain-containing protein, partial [Spirochaetota bacterium]
HAVSLSQYNCTKCSYHFYQNSKPATGALITRRSTGNPLSPQEVLLTKRGIEPYQNWWDTPGGFLHNGEEPVEGLRREVMEELGVEITDIQLFAAFPDIYPRDGVPPEASHTLCLYFTCRLTDAEVDLNPQDDITEYAWFPLTSLPEKIAFNANRKVLEKLKETVITAP